MAVKDQRFYWLKLKAEFMTGDVIDFLMSQKNGANYVVLYQMLCVKTINTHGELATKLGDVLVPFDIDKIQRECKWFDRDTVIVAMELYKRLGLICEQVNGVIKITDFESLVGSETYWAKQKRLSSSRNEENESVGKELENIQQPLISIYSSNISTSNSSNSEDNTSDSSNKKTNSRKKREKKTRADFIPPTLEEVIAYAKAENVENYEYWANRYFKEFTEADWYDYYGNAVLNWKNKFRNWLEYKLSKQGNYGYNRPQPPTKDCDTSVYDRDDD